MRTLGPLREPFRPTLGRALARALGLGVRWGALAVGAGIGSGLGSYAVEYARVAYLYNHGVDELGAGLGPAIALGLGFAIAIDGCLAFFFVALVGSMIAWFNGYRLPFLELSFPRGIAVAIGLGLICGMFFSLLSVFG